MKYAIRLLWFWVKLLLGALLLAGLLAFVFNTSMNTASVRVLLSDGLNARATQALTPEDNAGLELEMFFTKSFLAMDQLQTANPYAGDHITSFDYQLTVESVWCHPFRGVAEAVVEESIPTIRGSHPTGETDAQGAEVTVSPAAWPHKRYRVHCVRYHDSWYMDRLEVEEELPAVPTPTPEPSMTPLPTVEPLPTPAPTNADGQPQPDNPPDNRTMGTINTESVNVRTGPATHFTKVGTLSQGEQVEILGEEDGWYKIRFQDGEAFVSKKLIDVQ